MTKSSTWHTSAINKQGLVADGVTGVRGVVGRQEMDVKGWGVERELKMEARTTLTPHYFFPLH